MFSLYDHEILFNSPSSRSLAVAVKLCIKVKKVTPLLGEFIAIVGGVLACITVKTKDCESALPFESVAVIVIVVVPADPATGVIET